MDLLGIAKLLAPIAPVAGSIIGGLIPFPGASLIGQKLGTVLAQQFGVPVESLEAAIKENTNEIVLARINAAMEIGRKEIDGMVALERATLEAQVKNLSDVNATMRVGVDLAREHVFYTGWRAGCGWVFVIVALAFGVMLTAVTGVTAYRSPDPLKALDEAWKLFCVYFVVLGAIVGVLIPSRTAEKKAAILAGVPMPNARPATPAPAVVKPPATPPARPPVPVQRAGREE